MEHRSTHDYATMTTPHLKFGIPDIELACSEGRKINPSSFAGHSLVVVFCPLDPEQAASEAEAYRRLASKFVAHDAWILAIGEDCGSPPHGATQLLTISDADRHAWTAFRDLTDSAETLDRGDGAVFFFSRGGGLHRYWHGSGHAHDVLEELQTPVSQHRH